MKPMRVSRVAAAPAASMVEVPGVKEGGSSAVE